MAIDDLDIDTCVKYVGRAGFMRPEEFTHVGTEVQKASFSELERWGLTSHLQKAINMLFFASSELKPTLSILALHCERCKFSVGIKGIWSMAKHHP